jgi:hypothetical protein
MAEAAAAGFATATEAADYLARRGLDFRSAHQLVGRIVRDCIRQGRSLTALTYAEWQGYSKLFRPDIVDAVQPASAVKARKTIGGTAPASVRSALKRAAKLLAVLLAVLFLAGPARADLNSRVGTTAADFLRIAPGARAASLGEAFTAQAADATALNWNPAGMSRLGVPELTAMHLFWLGGTNYEYFGYAMPVGEDAGFGASLTYLNYGKIERYDDSGSGNQTGDFSAGDLCVGLGYSTRLSAFKPGRDLLGGVGLKFIRQSIDSTSGSSVAADLGLLFTRLFGRVDAGLVLHNLGPKLKLGDGSAALPGDLRLGLAWWPTRTAMLTMDCLVPFDNNIRLGAGLELRPAEFLSLRGGYFYRLAASEYTTWLAGLTAGLGLSAGAFGMDYAFAPYGDLGLTHRISAFFRFGYKPPPPETQYNSVDDLLNPVENIRKEIPVGETPRR